MLQVLRVSDNSPIKDYMWLSVMNMFFFFPLAVVGVMLSLKVLPKLTDMQVGVYQLSCVGSRLPWFQRFH